MMVKVDTGLTGAERLDEQTLLQRLENLVLILRSRALETEVLRQIPQASATCAWARHQTKISGSFRSQRNAKAFATVRSYIETGRKHGANPIEILGQLFQHDPWRIPRPAL